MIKRFSIFAVLLILVIVSCKKDKDNNDNSPGFDQGELLVNWGNNIIVPAYSKYQAEASILNTLIQALPAVPSTNELKAVKVAHVALFRSWQKISFFEFGPASDIVLRAATNVYPTDISGVNSKIKNQDYSFSGASDLSKKGLSTIDYLLYGSTQLNANRVAYLKAISTAIFVDADKVNNKWKSNGGNYVATFNSATGNDAGSSIGIMINAINQHLEKHHRESKIGIPNGERSFSKTPLPGNVESFYEGKLSVSLGIENLKAIEAVYLGTTNSGNDGVGLEEYLNTIEAKYNGGTLDNAIKEQFKACFTAYNQISVPLKEAVINENKKVSNLFKELQKLIVLFKADVPAALSVLITYQDSDGD